LFHLFFVFPSVQLVLPFTTITFFSLPTILKNCHAFFLLPLFFSNTTISSPSIAELPSVPPFFVTLRLGAVSFVSSFQIPCFISVVVHHYARRCVFVSAMRQCYHWLLRRQNTVLNFRDMNRPLNEHLSCQLNLSVDRIVYACQYFFLVLVRQAHMEASVHRRPPCFLTMACGSESAALLL
jgi:hypothetical protein